LGAVAVVRTLVYIPIIHTQADMGALGALLQRIKASRVGPERLKESAKRVDEMWDEIERTVECLPVVAGKVRVYQDGLAVCGHESQIVRELADAGSRNHQLLVRLQERGAILMGTESPELLIEEYQLATASLHSAASGSHRRQEQLGRTLLEKRDRFIAGRINSTLQHGETGILFVGMLHSVQRYLERNFEIRYPIKAP
jgi:DUF917 family protein